MKDVSTTVEERQPTSAQYDLSVVLTKPAILYEKQFGNQWLLFAPDWVGWPILVEAWVHDLLGEFESPTAVGKVFSRLVGRRCGHPEFLDFQTTSNAVAFLEENGFLRSRPVELPYRVPEVRTGNDPKSMSVWLHITNACNLTCSYCFVDKCGSCTMSEAVSMATADSLAATAKAHGVEKIIVKFAGGEPTLALRAAKRFRKRLDVALRGTRVQTHVALLSNGTKITEDVIDFLLQPHTSISISLDGYGAFHDIYRRTRQGMATWDTITRNFDLLQSRGISPFVMGTVSESSRGGLPDLLRWVMSRGLRVRISIVRDTSHGADHEPYASRMASAVQEGFAAIGDERFVFDPGNDLHVCELRFEEPASGFACGIGTNHLVIKPDGTLTRCPMTVNEAGVRPDGDLLAACRKTFPFVPDFTKGPASASQCLNCQWFPVCAGGCPVYNERTMGHPLGKSPLCSFYRTIIPSYLDLFSLKLQQGSHCCLNGKND